MATRTERLLAAVLATLRQGSSDGARWNSTREQWGRAIPLGPPWTQSARRPVTAIDAPVVWRVPQQQVVLLQTKLAIGPGGARGILRWVIDVGTGGALETFVFDAVALQQISLPGETVRISLRADDDGAGVFDFSTVTATVTAMIADGNTSSSPAQYTQFFAVPLGPPIDFAIPPGATAFRVAGIPNNAGDPFVATTQYSLAQVGSVFFDLYTGTDMLAVHKTGDWIPLPGTPDRLRVAVAGAGVQGALVWRLDL